METMTTGRFPFSGGSVGSFVNQISPRCGLVMREFLLIQSEIASGKFSPQSVFFDFGFAQAVIVGGDIGFERHSSLFHAFFLKQLVQECGLGVQLSLACLLLQVRETCGGKRKRTSLLYGSVCVGHNTSYHIIGMIIMAHPKWLWLPVCRATLGLDGASPVPTRTRRG